MRILISLALGMLVGAAIFTGEFINQPSTALYRIAVNDRPFCSAFKVSNNKLLTAKHCCENLRNNTGFIFSDSDGSGIEDILMHPETTYDACIITTKYNLRGNTVKLGEDVYAGETLYSYGHGDADYPRDMIEVVVTNGQYISSPIYFLNISMPTEFLIEADGMIIKGMSGGPVLNESNEVVGINARVNTEKETSYFVPIKRIKGWINENI